MQIPEVLPRVEPNRRDLCLQGMTLLLEKNKNKGRIVRYGTPGLAWPGQGYYIFVIAPVLRRGIKDRNFCPQPF